MQAANVTLVIRHDLHYLVQEGVSPIFVARGSSQLSLLFQLPIYGLYHTRPKGLQLPFES